jgi:hypothetical protein
MEDRHDALSARKRKRLEQHGVDEGEHRRVGPDAERQSGDERRRKPGV